MRLEYLNLGATKWDPKYCYSEFKKKTLFYTLIKFCVCAERFIPVINFINDIKSQHNYT